MLQGLGMQLLPLMDLATLAETVGVQHRVRTVDVMGQCRGPRMTMGELILGEATAGRGCLDSHHACLDACIMECHARTEHVSVRAHAADAKQFWLDWWTWIDYSKCMPASRHGTI